MPTWNREQARDFFKHFGVLSCLKMTEKGEKSIANVRPLIYYYNLGMTKKSFEE